MRDIVCSKCGSLSIELLPIEIEDNKEYYFCKSCLKNAQNTLSMKIYLNKDERKLLKAIRKYLKYEKN